MANKYTLAFFFLCLFFWSCPLAKSAITSITFIIILWCSYKTRAKDNDKRNIHCHLLVFLWNHGKRQQQTYLSIVFFSYITKDDNDPLDSLSSSTCFHWIAQNNDKPLGSLSSCAGFSSITKDNNELFGSLSSFSFFSLCYNNIFGVIYLEFALRHLI